MIAVVYFRGNHQGLVVKIRCHENQVNCRVFKCDKLRGYYFVVVFKAEQREPARLHDCFAEQTLGFGRAEKRADIDATSRLAKH